MGTRMMRMRAPLQRSSLTAKALTAAGWIVVIGGSLLALAFARMLVVAVPLYVWATC
jgi:hypothetical protein